MGAQSVVVMGTSRGPRDILSCPLPARSDVILIVIVGRFRLASRPPYRFPLSLAVPD